MSLWVSIRPINAKHLGFARVVEVLQGISMTEDLLQRVEESTNVGSTATRRVTPQNLRKHDSPETIRKSTLDGC